MTGLIASTATVLIWYAIPSVGPSAHFTIASDLVEQTHLVVAPEYGERSLEAALNGISLISPVNDLGLVAFPSFHTGMAAMAV